MSTGPEFPGNFGTALNNVNGVHGIHSQVSGDVINVGGRSAMLFGWPQYTPTLPRMQYLTARAVSTVHCVCWLLASRRVGAVSHFTV